MCYLIETQPDIHYMHAYIGVTDNNWFQFLKQRPHLEEVNFWQPGGSRQFKAIQPGELFLFKLHSPYNFIVGGGLFAHSSLIPISLAWESFGEANGANDIYEMRKRVSKYRTLGEKRYLDYTIGCIILKRPFFLPKQQWIPIPEDWKPNIVQGKTYDLTIEPGLSIWSQLNKAEPLACTVCEEAARYGKPQFFLPRLGQGTFRIVVTDVYERRCALTNERTLPALDAAHIKPYSASGEHSVNNGILMRRDLHALFDRGYLTISPAMDVEVSCRIKEEFKNGRDYYRLNGGKVRLPLKEDDYPSKAYLEWHNSNVYLG